MAKTVSHKDLKSYFGDEDHLEVAQEHSFSELIFEMLTERKATSEELKVFELILNLSIDHGHETPSAIKVIEEAKKGETISEAVSEGIEEINDQHGGAAEPLMRIMYRVKSQESRVEEEVKQLVDSGKRMAGFGHRIYKDSDPRAQLILKVMKDQGMNEEFMNIAQQLESELNEQTSKRLPLNIDGAIAVAFCTLGFDPKLGKAVFIIARTPGLCAHYLHNA